MTVCNVILSLPKNPARSLSFNAYPFVILSLPKNLIKKRFLGFARNDSGKRPSKLAEESEN